MRVYRRILLAAVALLFVLPVHSESDNAQLHQAVLDLTNPWTVMCVAAHPDDEDGSSLTVLRRKYGVHTVTLFSTFGEGGQNAVGPELYEDLGVIRARETMAAAEVQGSEPYFLGFRDFGFSKSAEETFRAWGERETLRRMVLQIRRLRPDAIITNHDTTSGHGHHQATGRIVLQAFDAAADPKQFPEQLNEAGVWQVQRLFVRSRGGDAAGGFTIDPNETDPVRGMTYAQQALAGLQKHASQGPWPKTVPASGGRISRYGLVKQAANTPALPADAKTPIDGLQLPEQVSSRLVAPTIEGKSLTEFSDRRLEVLVALINARRRGAFTATPEVAALDPQRFKLMSSRLDKALAVATGVSVNINPAGTALVPGEKTKIMASLSNNGVGEIQIKQLTFRGLGLEARPSVADKM
jgi:LmbE family N-acetylglucosaminyl deacetylase